MERKCPSCGAGLETPLACSACGVLIETDDAENPFEVLGLEPSIDIDPAEARKRLRRFTRLVHPDFFATEGGEQLARAERNNALLNHAYDVVSDELRRADWIVRHLGGPTQEDLGAMPQEFLMDVMEWNEVLDEASAGSPEIGTLEADLCAHRESVRRKIHEALDPLPASNSEALADVRRSLNAYRYIDRALSRIAQMPYSL
ncbi:MAG: iron-sulfur cluster co-chaperone HscB C-terminal domain-containing protein [Planctomycetota bacterium]